MSEVETWEVCRALGLHQDRDRNDCWVDETDEPVVRLPCTDLWQCARSGLAAAGALLLACHLRRCDVPEGRRILERIRWGTPVPAPGRPALSRLPARDLDEAGFLRAGGEKLLDRGRLRALYQAGTVHRADASGLTIPTSDFEGRLNGAVELPVQGGHERLWGDRSEALLWLGDRRARTVILVPSAKLGLQVIERPATGAVVLHGWVNTWLAGGVVPALRDEGRQVFYLGSNTAAGQSAARFLQMTFGVPSVSEAGSPRAPSDPSTTPG